MKKVISLTFIAILIVFLSFLLYNDLTIVLAEIQEDIVLEIGKEYKINDFVKKVTNGSVYNDEEIVMFDTIGPNSVNLVLKNRIGNEKVEKINVQVVDYEAPTIENVQDIIIARGKEIDLTKNIIVNDNSNELIKVDVLGEYYFDVQGEYNLKYRAQDKSGNETIKDFKLIVEEKNPTKDTYYVKINKTLNVVMVYAKDKDNNYTNLVKTLTCSAGKNTPLGTFRIPSRSETIAFAGGKYGHYATRITGAIFFHSVPYYSKGIKGHWTNLMYNEYNKLGSHASAGCIRLAVIDAKWIFENVPNESIVEIYESDSLPNGVLKPTPIKIDVNSSNKGWDPTDPDLENPWLK